MPTECSGDVYAAQTGWRFLFEREEENETCQSNDQTADSQMTLFE